MILVLLGTHHQPFDRLVRAADALALASGRRVVVQAGFTAVPAPHCEVHAWLPPAELGRLADAADAVVAHAGPGSLALAWDRGRVPLVVPRRRAHGEHVDDHQVRYARTLGERAVVVDDPADLPAAWSAHRDVLEARGPAPGEPGVAFTVAFGELVDALVREHSDHPGPRATLRRLLTRLGSRR